MSRKHFAASSRRAFDGFDSVPFDAFGSPSPLLAAGARLQTTSAPDLRPVEHSRTHPDVDTFLSLPNAPIVGVGVVATYDFAMDRELWRWTPEHVSLHITRTPWHDAVVDVDMARLVSGGEVVAHATRNVMKVSPLAVGYACTAGSFVDGPSGEAALRHSMELGGAPSSITTTGALTEAVKALGTTKLSVVTPYTPDITARLTQYLAGLGIETVSTSSMGLVDDIWRVPYADTVRLVLETTHPAAEAVFISCTNLATYDIIAPLEQALGIPVLSANQVTMWATLRAAGLAVANSSVPQRLLSDTATISICEDSTIVPLI